MLFIVGVSHRNAPLDVREALAFPRDRLAEALHRMLSEAGVAEAMILSTCNRVELYGRAHDAAAEHEPALSALANFLAGYHGRSTSDLESFVYRLEIGRAHV